jgi:hypothetical protein
MTFRRSRLPLKVNETIVHENKGSSDEGPFGVAVYPLKVNETSDPRQAHRLHQR